MEAARDDHEDSVEVESADISAPAASTCLNRGGYGYHTRKHFKLQALQASSFKARAKLSIDHVNDACLGLPTNSLTRAPPLVHVHGWLVSSPVVSTETLEREGGMRRRAYSIAFVSGNTSE